MKTLSTTMLMWVETHISIWFQMVVHMEVFYCLRIIPKPKLFHIKLLTLTKPTKLELRCKLDQANPQLLKELKRYEF